MPTRMTSPGSVASPSIDTARAIQAPRRRRCARGPRPVLRPRTRSPARRRSGPVHRTHLGAVEAQQDRLPRGVARALGGGGEPGLTDANEPVIVVRGGSVGGAVGQKLDPVDVEALVERYQVVNAHRIAVRGIGGA